MSDDIKIIKKEVKSFLLINFGLIAFISIFIFISLSKANSSDFIVDFAGLFMYIPAFSAIVVLRRISNYDFNPEVNKFFKVFAITTLVRLVISICQSLFINSIWISSIMDLIMSAYFLYFVLVNRYEFEVLNLSLGKNSKKLMFVILLFIIIIIGISIPSLISTSIDSMDMADNIFTAIINAISNFLLGFNLFFGEEFGWRYFLQPRLQKLHSKRWGVIILGIIWGIWHAPLCITLYSPETPFYCIIGHLSTCVFLGIYFAYAYMKTENLWAPILLHLVNNVIGIIFGGGYTSVYTLENLLGSIIISAVFLFPFIFTKEFRNNKDDETQSLHI